MQTFTYDLPSIQRIFKMVIGSYVVLDVRVKIHSIRIVFHIKLSNLCLFIHEYEWTNEFIWMSVCVCLLGEYFLLLVYLFITKIKSTRYLLLILFLFLFIY